MAHTIALANQKGGVAKTTSTLNIAAALVAMGKRVLAVDLDPQGSLTIACGADPIELEHREATIAFALMDGKPIAPMVIATPALPALIPSSLTLSRADVNMHKSLSPNGVLKKRLHEVREGYDYILIDCPPNLSTLSLNGLVAADSVLIPVKTDYLSVHGVAALLGTVGDIRDELNPGLRVLGCIPTLYKRANNIDNEALATLRQLFEGIAPVFDPIRQATHIEKAHMEGRAAVSFGGPDSGAEGYVTIAQYITQHTSL